MWQPPPRARHSPAVAEERAPGARGLCLPWGAGARCWALPDCGEAPAELCVGRDGAEARSGRSAPPRSAWLIHESFISWLRPWPHPAASRRAAQVAGAAAPSRCRRLQHQSPAPEPAPSSGDAAQGRRAAAFVRGCGTGRPRAAGAERGREELACRVHGGAAGRLGRGGGQTDRWMSLVQCDHTGGAGGSSAPLCTGTCPGAGAGEECGPGAVQGADVCVGRGGPGTGDTWGGNGRSLGTAVP